MSMSLRKMLFIVVVCGICQLSLWIHFVAHEQHEVSILTFNIEVFNSADFAHLSEAGDRVSNIIQRITKHGPDLILLQEDLYPSPLASAGIANYELIGTCKAELLTWPLVKELYPEATHLANSIWAKQAFIDQYRPQFLTTSVLNMSQGCPDPRCTVIADFGSFSIANVHLCGGRYIDEIIIANASLARGHGTLFSKDVSLEQLVKRHNPTFIAGDFNGERDRDFAQSLGGYSLFRNASPDEKKTFADFFHSGHGVLEENGYSPLYREDDVQSTTRFGVVSDWVYFKEHRGLKLQQTQFEKVDAIDISDHHAVIVHVYLQQ